MVCLRIGTGQRNADLLPRGFQADSDIRRGFQPLTRYGSRREPPEAAATNSQQEFTMNGHLTEIILLGALASGVVLAVLELCWTLWESEKSPASNRTE
jgi:hypothetical protein